MNKWDAPSWMPAWMLPVAIWTLVLEAAVVLSTMVSPWLLVPVTIFTCWPYRRPIWRGITKVNAAMASAAEWWARGVD